MIRLMLLPYAVVLAHALGDFVVQTDWQAVNKPHDWRAMAAHLTGYHIPMATVAIWGFGLSIAAAVFLLISVVTHAFFDRRWPVIRLMTATGSAPFAQWDVGRLIVDQVCHLTCLFAAVCAALALT